MNDSQFESSLRAFRPSAPPAAIEERIAAHLPEPRLAPSKKVREPVSIRFEQAREPLLMRCFRSLGWAFAGAASAVAAIALYPAKFAPERPAAPAVRISAQVGDRPASDRRDLSSAPSPRTAATAIPISTIPVSTSLPAGAGESADFQAMETTREFLSTEEEGQVLYRSGSPMRQIRSRYREHHSWTNPRTGARMDIEIPREDVFLQPVSLQ